MCMDEKRSGGPSRNQCGGRQWSQYGGVTTDGNCAHRVHSLCALEAAALDRKVTRSLLRPWGTVNLKQCPS